MKISIIPDLKNFFSIWIRFKFHFIIHIISGMVFGGALQYNWALDHNFWKDFTARITLGPVIFVIILTLICLLLARFLGTFAIKNQETIIQNLSYANIVFIFSGLIFFLPEVRFKIFVILTLVYILIFFILFKKEVGVIIGKVFPRPPADLEYQDSENELCILVKGEITKETVPYLYENQLIEEEGLFNKKIKLNLEKVQKIDNVGLYWLLALLVKTRMSEKNFEIEGDLPLWQDNKEKRMSQKEFLSLLKV